MKTFYLTTHETSWLHKFKDVPLFISHRRLQRNRKYRAATTDWALDSGGFTELSMYGEWVTSPKDYIHSVRRYIGEIGRLDWISPQDWMCEEEMLRKTGLTVPVHQRLTGENYLDLLYLAPDLEDLIIPVLQGFTEDDYHRCVDMYERMGIDLQAKARVGVGSVCRRQGTSQIGDLFASLRPLGLKLHGYGVKTNGLKLYGDDIYSSDSLAWSYNARKMGYYEGVVATENCKHATCANCPEWALMWRQDLLEEIGLQM